MMVIKHVFKLTLTLFYYLLKLVLVGILHYVTFQSCSFLFVAVRVQDSRALSRACSQGHCECSTAQQRCSHYTPQLALLAQCQQVHYLEESLVIF